MNPLGQTEPNAFNPRITSDSWHVRRITVNFNLITNRNAITGEYLARLVAQLDRKIVIFIY